MGSSLDSNGQLVLNATTSNILDSADGLITSVEAPENMPRYFDVNYFDPNQEKTAVQAKFKYSSFASSYLSNVNRGYGIPNTSARPIEYITSTFSEAVKFPTTVNQEYFAKGDQNRQSTTFNCDRETTRGMTIKSDSSNLEAPSEPVKVEEGYYYISSDIVDEASGYVTYNQLRIPIVGIVSKLDTAQDYYFSDQSTITHYVRKKRTLNKIRVTILTNTLEPPANLGENSSVVFQIIQNQQVTLAKIPIWQQQEIWFKTLISLLERMNPQFKKKSEESIIEDLFKSLLPPDEQPEVIEEIQADNSDIPLLFDPNLQKELDRDMSLYEQEG